MSDEEKTAAGTEASMRMQYEGFDPEEDEVARRAKRSVMKLGKASEDDEAPLNPTWGEPVDLAAVIAGGLKIDPPVLGRRSDGVCLLYRSAVHWVFGEPEAGKGLFAVLIAAEVLAAGGQVLILDFESTVQDYVGRLQGLGVSDEAIVERVAYLSPEPPPRVDQFGTLLLELAPDLAILDGVDAAMRVLGLDPNTADVNDFYRMLLRPMARNGAATIAIDHVVKSGDNRRWPKGNGAKLGLADVGLGVECIRPFGRNVKNGLSRVVKHKDRFGWLSQYCRDDTLALLELSSTDPAITATLTPPDARAKTRSSRPAALMEEFSVLIEATPGLSQSGLLRGVRGNQATKLLALSLLAKEGYVMVKSGTRNARNYHSLRPFRQADDSPDGGSE
jgi:hypothetical protein